MFLLIFISSLVLLRDPGVVGLLPYASEGRFTMYYGLIVDGYHTHDASIRLAYAMHPKGILPCLAIPCLAVPLSNISFNVCMELLSPAFMTAIFMPPLGEVLVTDAAEAMGLAPGEHRLGDMVVVLDNDHRLTVKGTDTLAGRCVALYHSSYYS
jgi:N-acetylglucosamine-6-phosphate deacetylase